MNTMWSIAPTKYIDSETNKTGSATAKAGRISVPRMQMDWVETTTSNQAPLIPASSEGFGSRTVTAVKKVYSNTAHNPTPTNQSPVATDMKGVNTAN